MNYSIKVFIKFKKIKFNKSLTNDLIHYILPSMYLKHIFLNARFKYTRQFQINLSEKSKQNMNISNMCFSRFYAANSSCLIRNLRYIYICLFSSLSVHSQKELSTSPSLSGRESLLSESQGAATRQTLQHDVC